MAAMNNTAPVSTNKYHTLFLHNACTEEEGRARKGERDEERRTGREERASICRAHSSILVTLNQKNNLVCTHHVLFCTVTSKIEVMMDPVVEWHSAHHL